eukprot:11220084-Prorocentrum_lima.AAC.1
MTSSLVGSEMCIRDRQGPGERGVYHSQTKLPGDREGLLIDIGAFDKLMGATEAGKTTIIEEQPGLNSVCGVGGSTNAVKKRAT